MVNDPFTIRNFVPDGDPEGVRLIDRMNWTGHGIVIPREKWLSTKQPFANGFDGHGNSSLICFQYPVAELEWVSAEIRIDLGKARASLISRANVPLENRAFRYVDRYNGLAVMGHIWPSPPRPLRRPQVGPACIGPDRPGPIDQGHRRWPIPARRGLPAHAVDWPPRRDAIRALPAVIIGGPDQSAGARRRSLADVDQGVMLAAASAVPDYATIPVQDCCLPIPSPMPEWIAPRARWLRIADRLPPLAVDVEAPARVIASTLIPYH